MVESKNRSNEMTKKTVYGGMIVGSLGLAFCVGCPCVEGNCPDLEVSVDNFIPVDCPTGGGSCADVTVTNSGARDAGKFDSDIVFDSGVVTRTLEDGLAVGASETFTVMTAPAPGLSCFEQGTRNCTVCATADSGGVVSEQDESNNRTCKEIIG
jgi:subtilase family serine protease